MQFRDPKKKSVSNSIINIAILAVSIGIAIIIIAISTGKGLQEKIKTKESFKIGAEGNGPKV